MSIHIVLSLLTKIIPMSCHLHFAHSAWKLFPRKLFWKIIPRCNLHIGLISDGRGHITNLFTPVGYPRISILIGKLMIKSAENEPLRLWRRGPKQPDIASEINNKVR